MKPTQNWWIKEDMKDKSGKCLGKNENQEMKLLNLQVHWSSAERKIPRCQREGKISSNQPIYFKTSRDKSKPNFQRAERRTEERWEWELRKSEETNNGEKSHKTKDEFLENVNWFTLSRLLRGLGRLITGMENAK